MTPERQARITGVLRNRQPDLTVVLENVHDPHNISAVMRSCDAVGIQDIYVLNTVIGRHDYYGKRSSATAADWLTVHQFDNTATCMEAVKQRYNRVFATHLGTSATPLFDMDFTEPIALVFGNEHAGITEECLAYCDGNVIVPQVGMVKSLNISVACAVTLYEAFRQKHVKGHYDGDSRLPKAQWQELADRWGYRAD